MMQSADRSKSSRHWIEIECFLTPGLWASGSWSKLNYRRPRVMATDNMMPRKQFFCCSGNRSLTSLLMHGSGVHTADP